MQTKTIIRLVLVTTLTVLILTLAGVGTARRFNYKRRSSLKTISALCESSVDSQGFGHVALKSGHLQNQQIDIATPCRLELKAGATLQLTNVQIKSNNLVIETKQDATKPTHIVINNSKFTSDRGGFQIRLYPASSTVSVKGSQFSYPLSVGISVGNGDDDSLASLQISNSSMQSDGADSQGILLVSAGQAKFSDNSFSLNDSDGQALLYGAECQAVNNINANNDCQDQ